ncbi:MAG TPA: hypothetical protein GXX28_10980 [Firmicutes bacterium]|nr:hypothetical protein [Bacillota bacterium]
MISIEAAIVAMIATDTVDPNPTGGVEAAAEGENLCLATLLGVTEDEPKVYPHNTVLGNIETLEPCITYHLATGRTESELPLDHETYVLNCWSKSYTRAAEIAARLKRVLHDHPPALTLRQVCVLVETSRQSLYEEDTLLHRIRCSYETVSKPR